MSTFTVDVEVEVTSEHLEAAGFHHEDDCNHNDCHDECISPDDALNMDAYERNETAAQIAADTLHDWHESEHGYTLWTMCQHGPCNNLTLDYRKRS